MSILKDRIKRNEGLRLKPYLCPGGYWTIGWCHRMKDGFKITIEMAEQLLEKRIHRSTFDFLSLALEMNCARKNVCIEMIFWHGCRGFLLFKETVKALKMDDWERAADEMMDSNSGRKYKTRMSELAKIMRLGV